MLRKISDTFNMRHCWMLAVLLLPSFLAVINGDLQFLPKPAGFRNQTRPLMSGGLKAVRLTMSKQNDPTQLSEMYLDETANLSVSIELLPNTTDSLYVEFVLPHTSIEKPLCLPYGVNKTIICNGTTTTYKPYFEVTQTPVVRVQGPIIPQLLFVPAKESESNSSDVTCETKEVCVDSSECLDLCKNLDNATCIPPSCLHLENNTCIGSKCLNWTSDRCPCNVTSLANATCIPTYCHNFINGTCLGNKCLNWSEHHCVNSQIGCSNYDLKEATCIPGHCIDLVNTSCIGKHCLNWTNDNCTVHKSCAASQLDNKSCIPSYCVNYRNATCVGLKCLNWTTDRCEVEEPCPCSVNKTTCVRRVQRSIKESYTLSMSTDKHAVFVVFDRIIVNSSHKIGQVYIDSLVTPRRGYAHIGGRYKFKSTAITTWRDDEKDDEKSVIINGALLDGNMFVQTSNLKNLEAGDLMDFKIVVKHDAYSQEEAAPLVIELTEHFATFVKGNLIYENVSETLTAANLTGIHMKSLPLGKEVSIHVNMVVPDNAPSGGGSLKVSTRYKPASRPNYRETYDDDKVSYKLKKPTVDFGQSQLIVPDLWSPGEVIQQKVTFKVPKGTTRGIQMRTVASGNSATVDKLKWVSSSVSAPGYITFSDPSLVNVGESNIQRIVSSRRKRTTSQTVSMTRVVGDLVNPGVGGVSDTPITITNDYVLDPSVAVASNDVFQLTQSSLTLNGQTSTVLSNNMTTKTGAPDLEITKNRKVWNSSPIPQTTHFTVTVKHTNISTAPAYDVDLVDLIPYHSIDYTNEVLPVAEVTPGFSFSEVNSAFLWRVQKLNLNETMVLSYVAVPKNSGKDLPENTTNYLSQLVYYSADIDTPAAGYKPLKYGPDVVGSCLTRKDVTKSNVVLDHGFTALSFFAAAIIAILVVVLIMCLYMRYTEGSFLNQVKPASQVNLRHRNLILDGGEAAKKKGWNTVRDFETISVDESIVCILSSNDKVQTQRDLDRLDILNTIKVDTEIENERNHAAVDTTAGLVTCLSHNKDITEKVKVTTTNKLHVDVKAIEKRLEVEFKLMLEEVYKGLSFKNKARLKELNDKQNKEKQNLRNKTEGMSTKEKTEITKLLKEQHQTEQDELTYLLKLEQDEESEKLRREFAIKKRTQLQQAQKDYLNSVIEQGKLGQQQADWLLKEHRNNQSRLEKIYDDEISRQRMVLDEKLARRKQLAAANESQEDDEGELLNTLAGHQIQIVNKMKQRNVLDQEEADVYIERIKQEMLEAKGRHDAEKARQAMELHKRLSEKKKARLEAKKKEQQQELDELMTKQQEQQTSQVVDPISLLESKMCVVSQQRNELSQLENEIDKEHAVELERLIDDLTVQTKKEIEQSAQKLVGQLKNEGADDAAINKLIQQHNKQVEQLQSEHEQNRLDQEEKFKRQLAKRRREWAQRREDEKSEQGKLREHDAKVIHNLIGNQVAMSEDERDRILQEHEKQMVKLENNLTLNKLQQQRMLGEKLAAKKKQQMEKLQKKQVTEIKKQEKSQARNVDDEDEDEQHTATLELLRKQAQQRLDLLHGQTVDYTQELENVKDEMIKERAISLKDQEDRLGAMMANLQLEKAREMAKIEEQQKAIIDLKANLMEDLNDRGVLSDPQCKKVIDRHHEETEKLNAKLDNQRAKQEQALKKKLEQKLEQRENTMLQMQKSQLTALLENAPNKTAAKLQQMALMHKQKKEAEEFRERMTRQINQNVQELRRQQEIKKKQVLQEKELQFIAGLVRLGHLKRDELVNVLGLLFPDRSNDELEAILKKIHVEQNEEIDSDENDTLQASSASMLESRIKSARLSRVKTDHTDTPETPPKSRKKKGRLSQALKKHYSRDEDAFGPDMSLPALGFRNLNERPEPVGAAYNDDDEIGEARRKLPPLKQKGKKKRKSKPTE